MKYNIKLTVGLIFLTSLLGRAQERGSLKSYYAGFTTIQLVDSSRIYNPKSIESDSLHHRPVDVDIWYPSLINTGHKLIFKDLFTLLERRANRYQAEKNYEGLTEELAQFYALEFGLGIHDGKKLLQAATNTYSELIPSKEKFPIIIYFAGLNGMGFENFKILEMLVAKGYIVAVVSSVGRYPGDMTNHKLDMMEQVYDAEFILDYLKVQTDLSIDFDKAGILGCSWGGMSAAVFLKRNPAIAAFISLDGSETSYFGESADDDTYIKEIHNASLLSPENCNANYLYMESGNKLETYSPTEIYNYYKRLASNEKYYLRFLQSKHEDFTSFPTALQVSQNAIKVHEQLSKGAGLFFDKHLKKIDAFNSYYDSLTRAADVSTSPTLEVYEYKNEIVINGVITHAETKLPLAYASIGVLQKETGTVADENGKFLLRLASGMENDTIKISVIGYRTKTLFVTELLAQKLNVIELQEEISQLSEVVVTAHKIKNKTLGNKTMSRFVSTGFGYDQLGAEIGIKINVRKKPTFVDAFSFNISHNRLRSKALFRLNIYDIEKGKPFKNIMPSTVIIPVDAKQTGLMTVDLKTYNIVLNEDVIVTLEWIKSEGDNQKGDAIYFSLGVFNNGTLIKRASQGKFKKHSSMGVGMNLDVRF